jgi:hypothetical protein
MNRVIFVVLILFGAVSLTHNVVRAQAGGYALQQIKESLSRYDLELGTTMDTIRKLNEFVDEVTVEHEVRQARFIRAITSTNIIVIASLTGNNELIQSLADGMNISPVILPAFIEQELEDYARGIERVIGRQAVAALRIVDRGFHPQSDDAKQTSQLYRDLFSLDAVYRSLKNGVPLAAILESYADDPCGIQKSVCPYPFTSFNTDGRKAAFALKQIGQSARRLDAAAKRGEPVALFFQDYLSEINQILSTAELKPSPKIDKNLVAISEATKASKTMPDAIVSVTESELRFGFVPKIRLTPQGRLRVITAGKPILPQMTRVKLPTSYLPYMRAIDTVTQVFRTAIGKSTRVSVAVGPSREVQAHVIGRVLLSLRPLGIDEIYMLGLGEDGSPSTIPMQIVSSREVEEMKPAQVNLRIRLGGYTLKLGFGSKEDIPRIKGEEGYRFDVGTLAAKVGERRYRSAEVSFMGAVSSESLVAAMFQVVPDKDPIRLVIPQ